MSKVQIPVKTEILNIGIFSMPVSPSNSNLINIGAVKVVGHCAGHIAASLTVCHGNRLASYQMMTQGLGGELI